MADAAVRLAFAFPLVGMSTNLYYLRESISPSYMHQKITDIRKLSAAGYVDHVNLWVSAICLWKECD